MTRFDVTIVVTEEAVDDAMHEGLGCLMKDVRLLKGRAIFTLFEQDIVDDGEGGWALISISFGCLD